MGDYFLLIKVRTELNFETEAERDAARASLVTTLTALGLKNNPPDIALYSDRAVKYFAENSATEIGEGRETEEVTDPTLLLPEPE